MQLHNNQVPSNQIWALEVASMGTYDEHRFVSWFITAEESSAEYRDIVRVHTARGVASTVKRWKVTLPRQRMDMDEVRDYVTYKLIEDPDGSTQLLDVSVRVGVEGAHENPADTGRIGGPGTKPDRLL